MLGQARGGGSNPQSIGLPSAVSLVDELVCAASDGHPVVRAELYLSGMDLPRELDAFAGAVAGFDWAGGQLVIDNDLFALLRAGTAEPDAVAVVCGTGINAVGVRANGATARFPALGAISGDWGGGSGLGVEMLWHAVRAEDGRGPATALTDVVRERFGPIPALIEQLHFGERSLSELGALAPRLFEVAGSDAVAASLVDRLAAEVVALATSCLRRLDLLARAVPVVLGGGVLRAADPRLMAGIEQRLAAVAPSVRLVPVDAPPVLGAVLLALQHHGAPASVLAVASAQVTVAYA